MKEFVIGICLGILLGAIIELMYLKHQAVYKIPPEWTTKSTWKPKPGPKGYIELHKIYDNQGHELRLIEDTLHTPIYILSN